MRDAPDVEARSNYQPRHPSPTGSAVTSSGRGEPAATSVPEPPVREDDGQPISVVASLPAQGASGIAEPPIAEDDTRPRAALAPVDAEAIPPDLEGEPEFLEELVDLSRFEPPRDPTDTQPKRAPAAEELAVPEEAAEPPAEPVELKAAATEPDATEPLAFTPPEFLPDYLTPAIEPPHDTPVQADEAPDAGEPDFPLRQALADRSVESEAEATPEGSDQPIVSELFVQPENATVPVTESDQATIENIAQPASEEKAGEADSASIWDVFGVPRPSETEQTETMSVAPEAPDVEAVAVERIPLPNGNGAGRAGLRITLRRKLARVRRL
jgi:hypothetical protein